MTRHARVAPALLLLFACTFFAPEARADSLVVTGGTAVLDSVTGGPVTLVTSGMTINTGAVWGIFGGTTFKEGLTASIRSFSLGSDVRSGPLTLNGVNHGQVFYLGQMEFLGSTGPLTGPLGSFTVHVPFTFSATFQGCLTNFPCGPANIVFDTTTFTGQGMAAVEIIGFQRADGRHFSIMNVTYNFADPVPEPATLVLLSTGLAGAAAAARRRRRKS